MSSHNGCVAVIGFGYVGACLGAVLATRGTDVIGIDTNPKVIVAVKNGVSPIAEPGLNDLLVEASASGRLEMDTEMGRVAEADTVLMTVGTPLAPDGSIDDSALRNACMSLAKVLRPGQLVILKSTVTPGFTRDVAGELLATSGLTPGVDFALAFCPERLAEGTALHEIRHLPVLTSGITDACREKAARFWATALGVETRSISSVEAAELVKLATNWWIDHNIAMANELAQYCDLFGADVLDVIDAANDLPKGAGRVNILLPSVGVGGSCLTKDPWIAWSVAREQGVSLLTVEAARSANDGMPQYAVERIIDHLGPSGLDRARVAVLGMAFKNNTGDVRYSPAIDAIRKLRALGAEVRVHDPRVLPADVPEDLQGLVVASLPEAVNGAACVAFLAGHDEYQELTASDVARLAAPGALVFDGRMYFSRSMIDEMEGLGLCFAGVGRSGTSSTHWWATRSAPAAA